jgi:hypothetical protein
MSHLRTIPDARYGRGVPRHPAIGQPAPRFELPVHGTGDDPRHWSLDEALGRGHAVVLIFHRHIH